MECSNSNYDTSGGDDGGQIISNNTNIIMNNNNHHNKNKDGNETGNDMAISKLAHHSLQVSSGNGYRFPNNQFGFSLPPVDSFDFSGFDQILRRYMFLESYCDAVEDINHRNAQVDYKEVDLFQALFFPKTIAPRTPMQLEPKTIMTEKTISAMWFRLVAHYFEWITGVHEVQLLNDADKIRLIVCQLCRIVCLHVVFSNYHENSSVNDSLFVFGSGFYWDPARCTDTLMGEYCQEMFGQINRIIPTMRKLKISKQEFIMLKIAFFFDCNNLYGISKEGLEITRSLCCKYRTTLAEYVRHKINVDPNFMKLSETEKNATSLQRVRDLLNFPTCVEVLSEIDDKGLADMVKTNYGGMQGTLQKQIHMESKKVRL